MAKLPKKLKRQAKRDIRASGKVEKVSKTVRKYAFKAGDLVVYQGKQVLVLKDEHKGFYLIMTSEGQEWAKGSRLRPVREI